MEKPLNRDNILDLLREIYFPLTVIPQGADSLEDISDKFIGRFGCKDTAIPTWLEGQVPTVEEIERAMWETWNNSLTNNANFLNCSDLIHALIKRKLTGEGK